MRASVAAGGSGFIIDKARQARGIGCGDHGLDIEMAALNGQHEIACCGHIAAHNMHLRAQMVSHHAFGITNSLSGIE